MFYLHKFIREPMNAFTHFIGIVLSIIGLILLVVKAARVGTPLDVGAVAAFGISLILLYTASTVYHSVIAGPKTIAFF